ncbi:hypothetical protein GCM10007171_00100 [Dickeya fangzhongdai]|nr:hypothetical protein GCM10007171_00100 [Dickeya fangzhongdai]
MRDEQRQEKTKEGEKTPKYNHLNILSKCHGCDLVSRLHVHVPFRTGLNRIWTYVENGNIWAKRDTYDNSTPAGNESSNAASMESPPY